MFDLHAYLLAGAALGVFAIGGWLTSVRLGDASIVDSLWSLMFLTATLVFLWAVPDAGTRAGIVLALVGVWALRLAAYITWRHWGKPEDYRYQAIRRNNEPGFAWKSLYLVFGLQAVLAWIIVLPVLTAVTGKQPLGWLDVLGGVLWAIGFLFEAIGDAQLARFKADPANRGKVMDRGLWRYTRHPNYFGEFCCWWGIWLIALAAGGWWTILSPLLLTFLLLKVSGVAMLEKDIGERRPDYRAYAARTNAFFPGPPR